MKNILIILLCTLLLNQVVGGISARKDQFYVKFLDSHVRNLAREILDIYKNCKIITKNVLDAVDDKKCGTGLINGDLISDMYNKPLYYKEVKENIYILGFADNNLIQKTKSNFSHKPLAIIIDFEKEKIFISNGKAATLNW